MSLAKAFDSVNAGKFPYLLPRMSVALRLLIRRSEIGEHKLNISLADSDGKKLMSADLNINFQPPSGSIPEASFSFALNGQNISFPKSGDYVVDIIIDGRVEAIELRKSNRNTPLNMLSWFHETIWNPKAA